MRSCLISVTIAVAALLVSACGGPQPGNTSSYTTTQVYNSNGKNPLTTSMAETSLCQVSSAAVTTCRLTYYAANSNDDAMAEVEYSTNGTDCRQAAINDVASSNGPVALASSLKCSGTPILDQQLEAFSNFKVETLNAATCPVAPETFTFEQCQ